MVRETEQEAEQEDVSRVAMRVAKKAFMAALRTKEDVADDASLRDLGGNSLSVLVALEVLNAAYPDLDEDEEVLSTLASMPSLRELAAQIDRFLERSKNQVITSYPDDDKQTKKLAPEQAWFFDTALRESLASRWLSWRAIRALTNTTAVAARNMATDIWKRNAALRAQFELIGLRVGAEICSEHF